MHMPPPVHGAAMVGQYIHDSELINTTFDCHYINLTTAKNLQDIGKGGVLKIWKFIKLLTSIIITIFNVRPHLVYLTPNARGGAFYKDFIVVQLVKAMGCKVVVHYHNKGVKTREDKGLDNFLYLRFFKQLKVILLSELLYDDVKKYVNKEDIYICPNGIPYEFNTSKDSQNTIPHILMVSNLLIDKGILILLDALTDLKRDGYKFICDFVGGETSDIDKERFNNETQARDLDGIAIYHGKKYGKEKEDMYEMADIFTLPSFDEAFPLVNIEAMSHTLPIVSTNVGGIPSEVINGYNGLICETRDSKSLASCIKQLLDSPALRKEMGENGYKKFKTEFTLEAFEKRMTEILDTCTK